jgi:hypothetical protein
MIKTRATIALIQIGDNTHHQDHEIKLVNFRTIKATVSKPAKPTPLLELDELDISFSFHI